MTAPSPQAREALTEALAKMVHEPCCGAFSGSECTGPFPIEYNIARSVVAYLTSPEGTAHVLALLRRCPHGDPTCPCPDGLTCHYVDDPETGTKAMRPPAFWEGYQQAKTQAVRKLRRYADEHEHEGTYDGICRAADLVEAMRP